MKTMRTFTIGLMVLVLLAAQTAYTPSIPAAHAQTGDVSGNGGAVYCRNGARDWGSFISSVISYNGFVEYWKDILVRYNANMCLYLDIDSLMQRIDKTRELIRKAFYVCDSSAPKLKKTYYELEAELFFLRSYIDVGNGQVLIKPEKGVANDFTNYFVNEKGFFSKADADILLQKFMDKYNAKQDTYLNCKDPTWGNLIQKWNEFKTNLGGFSAIQEAADSIKKSWDKIVNTPFKRAGGMFGGLLDAKINSLDPATAWGDIAKQFSDNSPSGFTFDQFQAATAADNARYNQELTRTNYLGQYTQLYQEGTANIVQEIIDRVDYLKTTIESTYQYIDRTAACAKGVLDKVCS